MTIFWLVAICLLVAALLFMLPPLLRLDSGTSIDHGELNVTVYQDQLAELKRDLANGVIFQDQYDRNVQELERRMLQDVELEQESETKRQAEPMGRVTAIALAVSVPLASIMLYNHLGEPAGITGETPQVAVATGGGASQEDHPDTGQQLEAMIVQLEARMQADPNDIEGWLMLARSYRFLKRHDDAAQAFEKAMPMVQMNAQFLADYADTLAMARDGTLHGKPMELIRRALELDPNHVQALWLAGTYEYDVENYPAALEYWRRLQRIVPPGSQDAQAMASNIAEVEMKMREAGMEVPAPTESAPVQSQNVTPAKVEGVVTLDPALRAQVSDSDTVFIFARAADGPRMPLAILRKQVSDLPATFALDQSMAMMPAMSLANYPDIVVGARISKTGNAMAQSGDLQGLTDVVKVGTSNIEITIDDVVP